LVPILDGVPQGFIFSLISFKIYAADQQIIPHTFVADFSDVKFICISEKTPPLASQHLQNHLSLLAHWYSKWKIRINKQKFSHITFTLNKSTAPPIYLNNKVVPSSSNAKYLGLTRDKTLTWAECIKQKQLKLNSRFRAFSTYRKTIKDKSKYKTATIQNPSLNQSVYMESNCGEQQKNLMYTKDEHSN